MKSPPKKKEYVVYANAYPNRRMKKVRIANLIVVNSDGELICDVTGDATIGYYEGRPNQEKLKDAIKYFVEASLAEQGDPAQIPLEKISLKNWGEMEIIESRIKNSFHPIPEGAEELK